MRNKIDYGIDLGTTNSVISRMEKGIPVIIKTDTSKEMLPSCVHFDKNQNVIVGDMAYNNIKNNNIKSFNSFINCKTTNTFIEFKRTMGTNHTYECSNMGKEFTSEELSTEILKKLKSFIQDEEILSIVVTVPAKFSNPQNEATMRAAKLADFSQVELLQEPIAAATAYGLNSKNNNDGYWLVFDFGGGTFDIALIKAEEGILSVKDTDGDNMLGGKNLDDEIVDQLIFPYLKDNFSIDNILHHKEKREALRNIIRPFAEEAKVRMSSEKTYSIISDLSDLQYVDQNGDALKLNYELNPDDLEMVISPIFQKAINITKILLKRNNLKGSDLKSIILVGGPTYSPILRQMLKEQISNKIDASVDPMTVVARGAAIYASTISAQRKSPIESENSSNLLLDVKYKDYTIEMEARVTIKILRDKTCDKFPEKVYAELARVDNAWSSKKTLIEENDTPIDVALIENCPNFFNINVYDEHGNKLECHPTQLCIYQGIIPPLMVLPYHIGIVKHFEEYSEDLFQPVEGLEKNKSIPENGLTGVINGLKTRQTIRHGEAEDKICFKIYQSDYKTVGTDPNLNNLITEIFITGESLPDSLPEGSDVDVTIIIDRSQLMKFTAYFPLLGYSKEFEIEIKQTELPTEDTLSEMIANATIYAREYNDPDIIENLKNLEKQLDYKKGSPDGLLNIQSELRKELRNLDLIKRANRWPEKEKDLNKEYEILKKNVAEIINSDDIEDINNIGKDQIKKDFFELTTRYVQVMSDKSIEDASDLISEITRKKALLTGDPFLIHVIKLCADGFDGLKWKNKEEARRLVDEGLKMIEDKQTGSLRSILVQLRELMPRETPR